MKLNALEKKKDSWKIEVQGESHTLVNALREKSWEKGAQQASYAINHPYLSQPVITVRAENPKKVLSDSAQAVADDAKDFQKELARASKK